MSISRSAARAVLLSGLVMTISARASADQVGGKVPLVSAVTKIVPQDDLVLFSSTVNQSEMVAPVNATDWHDALSTTLQPLGLTFSDQGELVRIGTPTDLSTLDQPGYSVASQASFPAAKTLYEGQNVATPGFSLTSQPVGAPLNVATVPATPSVPPAGEQVAWSKPMKLIDTPNGPLPVQNVAAVSAHPALGEHVQQLQPTPLISADGNPTAGTPASAPVNLSPPPPPPIQVWTLQAGELASKNLMDWGNSAGWQVTWNYPKDFVIAHSATFSGKFQNAASKVVEILRQQMSQTDPAEASIHYDAYPPNKQFVVDSYNAEGN